MSEAVNDLIFNQFVISIIGFAITTIGGLITGFFVGRYKKHKKETEEEKKRHKEEVKAYKTIMKATARRLIFEAYDDYVIQKKKLTVDRFREITETYDAYTYLGGNGTAKKYYQAISEINPWLVTD